MRVVIAGYYGYRNWGDEGALATLLQVLPVETTTVLSGDPAFTRSTYGVHAVPRMEWRAVRAAIRHSDALIFGGGSLLQDATSLRSLLYYLALIHWGMRAHGQVWLVGQGVGPLRRVVSRKLVRMMLRRVPLISVRDAESEALLRGLGITGVEVDADLTWALEAQPAHLRLETGSRWVGLAPRPWQHAPVQAIFVRLCQQLCCEGYRPLLIPMQETQDRTLCEAIAAQSGAEVASSPTHPAQLLGLMHGLAAMVSMRLHGAIFAAAQGVPVLCISYDPKVDALAHQLRMPRVALAEAKHALPPAWQAFVSQRDALQEQLRAVVPNLRARAQQVLERLRAWVGGA
ncbi:MAG: polysaccharide pyruvyl transferase CsaB [Armatimonadota bacterium]|nr:polysaccharide pyruvyl transferase CsaB [Armatimonadota bacterium]